MAPADTDRLDEATREELALDDELELELLNTRDDDEELELLCLLDERELEINRENEENLLDEELRLIDDDCDDSNDELTGLALDSLSLDDNADDEREPLLSDDDWLDDTALLEDELDAELLDDENALDETDPDVDQKAE